MDKSKEPALTPEHVESCRRIVEAVWASQPEAPEGLTASRAKTRDRLFSAAEKILTLESPDSLQARALAKEAGVAVGSVYNVFEDLGALVLEVNGRTLDKVAKLGLDLVTGAQAQGLTARQTLYHLAEAYAGFIHDNAARWNATLNRARVMAEAPPDWYVEKQHGLFRIIEELLTALPDRKPQADLNLYARTLWGTMNGLITGGFHGNAQAEIARQDLSAQLKLVIGAVLLELAG